MQTFLPYASFEQSAKVLDRMRLGKQRVEAWQILNALDGNSKGWVNHPATKMWRNHEDALAEYGVAICSEWILRGYKDTMLDRFLARLQGTEAACKPFWFGMDELHASHRSNLLRKLPDHYKAFFPNEPDDLPYLWLVSAEN